MRSLSMQFVVALLSATFLLALYDRLMIKPALSMAVVDIPAVYHAKQAAFANAIVKDSSSDERARALAEAKVFAQRLPLAMAELAQECNCLLLDKSVVIGSRAPLPDLTEQLRKKVQ